MFAHFLTPFNGLVTALLLLPALAHPDAAAAQTNPWGGQEGPGSYADVNGIRLYYEIHGTGKPLVLLHGGLGAGSMFGPVLPALAERHKVILVDLQGHGRTPDIDRPLDVRFMADDIAALIRHLGLGRTDVMGYSLGGGVALQIAIRHPDVVDRLVVASAPFRRDGFYPDILEQQKQVNANAVQFMKDTPMYQLYQAVAARPQDFGRLLDKIGEMMKRDFSLAEDIRKIQAKTLVVAADADIFPPSHAVEMFALLGGGLKDAGWDGSGMSRNRLAILPGLTHYNLFADPSLAAVANRFLDEKP
jgi:pimeloyl-ACP methyl ester carboxylesterase